MPQGKVVPVKPAFSAKTEVNAEDAPQQLNDAETETSAEPTTDGAIAPGQGEDAPNSQNRVW